MHRLTASILDVINAFQNINFPIHEIFGVSTPPYYLDWFEISYPNVPLNQYDGPFFLQFINVIQGKKSAGQKYNRLLDAVINILKYNKISIDIAIYINLFSDETVSYLKVSTGDVLNTNNNET